MGKPRSLQTQNTARERDSKRKRDDDSDMNFRDLVQDYFEDRAARLRKNTITAKKDIVERMLLPFWDEMPICDITSVDVLRWQREILRQIDPQTGMPFPRRRFLDAYNQLSSIFDYAIHFCGLPKNPVKSVGRMRPGKGDEPASRPNVEYQGIERYVTDEQTAHCCRELLYWSGIREGELLALTLENIDLEGRTITVSKTLQSIPDGEFLAAPRQLGNQRKIKIPDSLCEELQDYIRARGKLKRGDRLFPLSLPEVLINPEQK